jgi:hypothetical protein
MMLGKAVQPAAINGLPHFLSFTFTALAASFFAFCAFVAMESPLENAAITLRNGANFASGFAVMQ